MRNSITVDVGYKMLRSIDRMARRKGVNRSTIVRAAINSGMDLVERSNFLPNRPLKFRASKQVAKMFAV